MPHQDPRRSWQGQDSIGLRQRRGHRQGFRLSQTGRGSPVPPPHDHHAPVPAPHDHHVSNPAHHDHHVPDLPHYDPPTTRESLIEDSTLWTRSGRYHTTLLLALWADEAGYIQEIKLPKGFSTKGPSPGRSKLSYLLLAHNFERQPQDPPCGSPPLSFPGSPCVRQ